ncbi:hypothetical protein [Thalassospira tepidiphila]|uniref:hypothetical protein n=1 Tax=Thalassospira tepidiphila TaxID=393657 RepID=UPI003AA81F54
MSKKILIYAFTLRRDAAAALILKGQLESRGATVVIACSYNFDFYLKYWGPDICLISTISRIENITKYCPSSEIVLWPGEGSEPLESSNALMIKNRDGAWRRISRILSWGEHDRQIFKQMFDDADSKVFVCGNPRLDLAKASPLINERTKNRHSIGIMGRFNSLNHYDGRPTIYSLNDTENLASVIDQAKGYTVIVNTIKWIVENTNEQIQIRPHPLEAPENYKYLQNMYKGRITIDESFDLAHWIAGQKLILTPSSTSFLEAYITKTPIINIEKLADFVQPSREIQPFAALSQDAGISPASYTELRELITSPPTHIKNEKIEAHLKHAHGWHLPQTAASKAADILVGSKLQPLPKIKLLQRWGLAQVSNIMFRKACRRNPLFSNFNYCEQFHKSPEYFAEITRLICSKIKD